MGVILATGDVFFTIVMRWSGFSKRLNPAFWLIDKKYDVSSVFGRLPCQKRGKTP